MLTAPFSRPETVSAPQDSARKRKYEPQLQSPKREDSGKRPHQHDSQSVPARRCPGSRSPRGSSPPENPAQSAVTATAHSTTASPSSLPRTRPPVRRHRPRHAPHPTPQQIESHSQPAAALREREEVPAPAQ